MNIVQVIILSLVEGITEFLPISSTGHLILSSKLLGITQTEFVKSFEIAIQLGAILSVVFLYSKTLIKNFDYWKKLIVAFIPTGLLGLVFYKLVKTHLLGNSGVVVFSLFVGGIFMLILDSYFAKKGQGKDVKQLSLKESFFIGLWQSISMIPGVSRAMATIYGGLSQGLTREKATEFSFLLAIPTMAIATGFDIIKSSFSFSPNEFFLLAVGFIGSFVSAMITVKFLINFVKKHDFKVFAYYRIILAITFYLIFNFSK